MKLDFALQSVNIWSGSSLFEAQIHSYYSICLNKKLYVYLPLYSSMRLISSAVLFMFDYDHVYLREIGVRFTGMYLLAVHCAFLLTHLL